MTTTTRPHTQPTAEGPAAAAPTAPAPTLDVVFTAHDREPDLEACIRRLHDHLGRQLPVTWRLTILDQASSDATWPIACRLARELPGVRASRLATPGRNGARHAAWAASDATILVLADLDSHTDLAALHPLVAPLLSGHSDTSVGRTAAARGRAGRRSTPGRGELIAIRLDRGPESTGGADWARFEAALLAGGGRGGPRTYQVPLDRLPEPEPTSATGHDRDGGGPVGLYRQAGRFAAIGVASTAAYLGLYVVLRPALGAFAANAIALLATAVANTAANRRLTFGISNRAGAFRHQLQGLGVFAVALGVTTASLAVLNAADPHPGRLLEASVLVAANLTATALRFVLLRRWVFRPARGPAPASR